MRELVEKHSERLVLVATQLRSHRKSKPSDWPGSSATCYAASESHPSIAYAKSNVEKPCHWKCKCPSPRRASTVLRAAMSLA